MGNTPAKPSEGASAGIPKEQQEALDAFLDRHQSAPGGQKAFSTRLAKYLLGSEQADAENPSKELRLSRLLSAADPQAQSKAVYTLANARFPGSQPTLASFVSSVCEQAITWFWHLHSSTRDEKEHQLPVSEWFVSWVLLQPDSPAAFLEQMYNQNKTTALVLDFSMLDGADPSSNDAFAKQWMEDARAAGKVDFTKWGIWWQGNTAFRELVSLALSSALFPNSPKSSALVHGVRDEVLASPQIPRSCLNLWLKQDGSLLSPFIAWVLCREMPKESRIGWECIYSSKRDGNSWSSFQIAVEHRGSVVLLVKEKQRGKSQGIFGAYMDSDLEKQPLWYGTSSNFLFGIFKEPNAMGIYRSTGFNSHYQYFNYATKTLPNGLGIGGQMEHFGLWISGDFTHGHSNSTATFGNSKQLSVERDFIVEEVEAWLVKPSTKDYDEEGASKKSALDTNPDAVAILEMANKTMYSKMVREPQLDSD